MKVCEMTKFDLTLGLIRFRFTHNGIRLGMSTGEAALMAEQRMKNEGLFGFLGKMKVAGTPEGAVVAIVEVFMKSIVRQLVAEPAVAGMVKGSTEHAEALSRHHANALSAIEDHRRKTLGGLPSYPADLKGYVHYRMELEMQGMHGLTPEDMGLDRETLDHMVDESLGYFRERIADLR